jgi:phosphate transport system substrate-binding protein
MSSLRKGDAGKMNKPRFTMNGLLFLALLAAGMLQGAEGFGATLAVPGTGACEVILTELAEAYNLGNPEEPINIPPSIGSGGGIKAVLDGEAQLARVARRLKAEEEQQGLVSLVFARDAVAFVVGKRVEISNMNAGQLAAIFTGKIDNWKDVGAGEGSIRVVGREPGDSSLSVIQEHLKEFKEIAFTPKAKIILYDRETVETLAKYKNSVGFIPLSAAKWAEGAIKQISLDGVAPTRVNVLAGTYRLVEDFAFVYKNELRPGAGRFVEFVFSEEGKKILEKNGLIAVDRR